MYNVLCSRLDRRKYPLVIESEEEEEKNDFQFCLYDCLIIYLFILVYKQFVFKFIERERNLAHSLNNPVPSLITDDTPILHEKPSILGETVCLMLGDIFRR